jgi:hypothetical protein
VSFWFAFAAARFSPEFMAHALAASFRHYSRDPHRNKTVPGQFSQWLHGETLVNQGMTLSPWFPPRYLWAAIEGAGGLNSSGGSPSVTPRLASDWKWLGVRNVPYRDRTLTWFVVRTPELARYSNFRSGKRRHSSATTTTLANSSASFANSQLADSRAQLPEPGSTLPRHR